jgi:hypothetical protein
VRIHRREQGAPELYRVRIACKLGGQPVALNLSKEEAQRLSMLVEGTDASPRTITVPPQSAIDLIGRQLSDRERDQAFRESMAVAGVMAQSVLRG